jgi:hypothetical protein
MGMVVSDSGELEVIGGSTIDDLELGGVDIAILLK